MNRIFIPWIGIYKIKFSISYVLRYFIPGFSLIFVNTVTAATIDAPPTALGAGYNVGTANILNVHGNLLNDDVILAAGATLVIKDGGYLSGVAASTVTTNGAGPITNIIIEQKADLENTAVPPVAISITNGHSVDLLVNGTVTGDIVYTTPAYAHTAIINGGKVVGNITAFHGKLDLDGNNPVVGTISGVNSAETQLNLGLNSPIVWQVDLAINTVNVITLNKATITTNAAISGVNDMLTISGDSILTLNSTISGTGSIINNGILNLTAPTSLITTMTALNNNLTGKLTIDRDDILPASLSIVNNGNASILGIANVLEIYNGPQCAANLILEKNITTVRQFENGSAANNNKSHIYINKEMALTTGAGYDVINYASGVLHLNKKLEITTRKFINNGKLSLSISSNDVFSSLEVTGETKLSDGVLELNETLILNPTDSFDFELITTTDGALVLPREVISTNIFNTWTPKISDDGLILSANCVRKPFNKIVNYINVDYNIATALDAIYATAVPEEITFVKNVISGNNSTEKLYKALDQLLPFSVATSAAQTQAQNLEHVFAHIAAVERNYLAGNDNFNSIWFRPIHHFTKQKSSSEFIFDGYINRTYGLLMGVDSYVQNSKNLVGVASGISFSSIKKSSQLQTKSNTTNINISVYGQVRPYTNFNINWLAGVVGSLVKQNRFINLNSENINLKSNYNLAQFNLKTSLGYTMWQDYLFNVIPEIDIACSHMNKSGYTETGSSLYALNVLPARNFALTTGIGAKLLLNHNKFKYGFFGGVQAKLEYLLIGKTNTLEASFVNHSQQVFNTVTQPKRWYYKTGINTGFNSDKYTIQLNYNLGFNSKIQNHEVFLDIKIPF